VIHYNFLTFFPSFGWWAPTVTDGPPSAKLCPPLVQTSSSGVPNLFLTMHPFSIPTNEHVPLQHFNR